MSLSTKLLQAFIGAGLVIAGAGAHAAVEPPQPDPSTVQTLAKSAIHRQIYAQADAQINLKNSGTQKFTENVYLNTAYREAGGGDKAHSRNPGYIGLAGGLALAGLGFAGRKRQEIMEIREIGI